MSENLADRVARTLASAFEFCCVDALSDLDRLCQSPIEKLLGATIVMLVRITGCTCVIGSFTDETKSQFVLTPQFRWDRYRVDFCLRDAKTGRRIFIECDGHDWHERTKEQAEHDRSRDREMTVQGQRFLRFIGREIYRDPAACADQVMEVLLKDEV